MKEHSEHGPVDSERRALIGSTLIGLAGCGGGANTSVEPTSANSDSSGAAALQRPTSPPVAQPPSPPAPSTATTPPLSPPTSVPAPGDPTPPAPSATAPPPPPPPPPASFDARIFFQRLALNSVVLFDSYHEGSRYERFRRLHVLTGDRAKIRFKGFDFVAGGVIKPLRGTRYTLLVDEIAKATVEVQPGTTTADFDLDLRSIEAGWRRLDVAGLIAGETCPTWWVFLQRGTVGEQPFTPVVISTYELTRRPDWSHAWAIAPGKYRPTPKPLERREFVPFDTTPAKSELHCMQLVPMRQGDIYRPNVNPAGIVSAFDRQAYFWSDLIAAQPRVPLLDGPRGVGTLSMATHVEVGRGPRGNVFACDPWRMVRVAADGTITTLVGHRHRQVATHWEDEQALELVGDWSSVPAARRGFHELWGFAWDERTLQVNDLAAPNPRENNEKPHIVGPVAFLADSQNDRVVKVEFSPVAHNLPPRVTEFLTGIGDPWDIVYHRGLIYVSERRHHRITAYDATTGGFVRVVVQGAAMAVVDRYRVVSLTTSLATARGQPCVAPEGLFLQDEWLYYGSKAQAQVRRVNLVSGEVQILFDVRLDSNSSFLKLVVSDGTFGPRGTVFIWTWSIASSGLPTAVLPDGKVWSYSREDIQGAGWWGKPGYPTAGAVGQGRLVTASVNEGLLVISKRIPSDAVASQAVVRGEAEYRLRGLHLLHGEDGFGFFGLELPFGKSPDIDAYLTFLGHRAGAA